MSGDTTAASTDPSEQLFEAQPEGEAQAPGVSGSDGPTSAGPEPVAEPTEQESGGDSVGGGADRVSELEARLASLQAEHESLRGQYMRMAADFDNFRKRQSRDQEDSRIQIACSTLSEILPVVDNFERARQQLDPQHEEAQALHRSYQGLYKQLVDVFKQLGVSPMRVEGEPFDPNLHEAVLREPSDDHGEDVVIAELQRGYSLQDRVLRHALVKVSRGPGPGGDGPAAGPASGGEQDG